MQVILSIIFLQFISICWGRSVPTEGTQGDNRGTMSPRQLWERLNTVDNEDTNSVEYSRAEPVSREFGTSPSSLYLMEVYRQIEDNEMTSSLITAFSASMFEGKYSN